MSSITTDLKLSFAEAVKNSPLSVAQICAKIYDMTGVVISPNMIYNYNSTEHPHLPRIDILPAVCIITDNYEPLRIVLKDIDISKLIDIQNEALVEKLLTAIKITLADFKENGHNGHNGKEVIQ